MIDWKKVFRSKTLWFGVSLLLSSQSLIIDELVKDNSSLALKIIAGIVVALRVVTQSSLIKQ